MPILDHSKTIIYKIVCKDLIVKDCHVGHTTDMTKRKYAHKFSCNNEKDKSHNLKIYKIIRETGGWDNWTMLLVEKFPCKDKHEACKREREIFEELGAIMNTRRPYITHEDKKQYDKQINKKYREEYKEHKEHLTQYQKKYREEHKEDKKQYDKLYREEHKAEIKEKIAEKVECKYCAKLLSKGNMSHHLKTCKSK